VWVSIPLSVSFVKLYYVKQLILNMLKLLLLLRLCCIARPVPNPPELDTLRSFVCVWCYYVYVNLSLYQPTLIIFSLDLHQLLLLLVFAAKSFSINCHDINVDILLQNFLYFTFTYLIGFMLQTSNYVVVFVCTLILYTIQLIEF
jgi:hypothetical protein